MDNSDGYKGRIEMTMSVDQPADKMGGTCFGKYTPIETGSTITYREGVFCFVVETSATEDGKTVTGGSRLIYFTAD